MHRAAIVSILTASVLVGCSGPTSTAPPTPSAAPAHDTQPTEPVKEQSAASQPTGESFNDEKLKLTFPPKLGKLTFVEFHPDDVPGLGYDVRYTNPDNLKIDIYVFDKGLLTIPEGHADPLIAKELAASDSTIRHYESKKVYLDVQQLATGVFPENPNSTDVTYLFSRYQYHQAARPGVIFTGDRISETFIRGYRDHFLKIRVSYPKALEAPSIVDRDLLLQHLSTMIKAGTEHPSEN